MSVFQPVAVVQAHLAWDAKCHMVSFYPSLVKCVFMGLSNEKML